MRLTLYHRKLPIRERLLDGVASLGFERLTDGLIGAPWLRVRAMRKAFKTQVDPADIRSSISWSIKTLPRANP